MRWARRVLLVLIIGPGALYLPNLVVAMLRDGPSTCHGQTKAGWIENSVRLNGREGAGRPYCWLCTRALRTYGHRPAVEAIEAAYDDLAAEFPETDWVYGESGFPWRHRHAARCGVDRFADRCTGIGSEEAWSLQKARNLSAS